MARTQVKGKQVDDGTIGRADLNVSTPDAAVITKIIAGQGITLDSSGVDDGTGDVIISTGLNVKQYVHTQTIPNSIWNIEHNLEGYPEVIVLDDLNERVFCDLFYTSSNIVIVSFSSPFSGIAALTLSYMAQTEFIQPTPEQTWVINHNLGKYPDVILFDTSMDNLRIYGDISYPSINVLVVKFTNATAGKLYLV